MPLCNCQNIFGWWAASEGAFAKWYELHYQSKTMETLDGGRIVQHRCLKFHTKRDDSPMLSLTIKNKWSSGWMKSWFYC
jgi:hypothetical protein